MICTLEEIALRAVVQTIFGTNEHKPTKVDLEPLRAGLERGHSSELRGAEVAPSASVERAACSATGSLPVAASARSPSSSDTATKQDTWEVDDVSLSQVASLPPRVLGRVLSTAVASGQVTASAVHQVFFRLRNAASIISFVASRQLKGASPLLIGRIIRSCRASLQQLDLSGVPAAVTDTVLAIIARCASLRTLNLADCAAVSASALLRVFRGCSTIEHLCLACVPAIDDDLIATFAHLLPSLASLDVSDCRQVGDRGLLALVGTHRASLRRIRADRTRVTSAAVYALMSECLQLETVSFAECDEISDTAFPVWDPESAIRAAVGKAQYDGDRVPEDAELQSLRDELRALMVQLVERESHVAVQSGENISNEESAASNLNVEARESVHENASRASASAAPSLSNEHDSQFWVDMRTLAVREADFSGCDRLTDRTMRWFACYCPDLRALSVQGCNAVTTTGVETVRRRCQRLTVLACGGIEATVPWSRVLAEQDEGSYLLALNVSWSPSITGDDVIDAVQQWASMTSLNMCGCHSIGSESISLLAVTLLSSPTLGASLTELDLSWCGDSPSTGIDDDSLSNIVQACCSLRVLRIAGAREVTSTGLLALAHSPSAPSLEVLDLTGVYQARDVAIVSIAESCTRLTHLTLDEMDTITDHGIVALCVKTKLKVLSISWCSSITDAAFDAMAQFASFEGLALRSLSTVSGTAVARCAPALEHARQLSLAKCDGVDDAALAVLARHCRVLQELDVSWLDITDESLAELGEHCASLRILGAEGCKLVTCGGLLSLVRGCTALVHVNLAWCDRIDDGDLQTLARIMPRTEFLDYYGVVVTREA